MVVRTRLRAILIPIVWHAVAAAVSFYFIQTALNGERGLKTKAEYKRHVYALRDDLEALKAERARWQHRVTLMRSDALDRDLSEEQARLKLDYVDRRDLVVFVEASRKR